MERGRQCVSSEYELGGWASLPFYAAHVLRVAGNEQLRVACPLLTAALTPRQFSALNVNVSMRRKK